MLANRVEHLLTQGESSCSKERGESTCNGVEHKTQSSRRYREACIHVMHHRSQSTVRR